MTGSKKESELANEIASPPKDPPPGYNEIDQIDEPPLTIPPLDLSYRHTSPTTSSVTKDECVAHLKFLAALADLRDSVAGNDGLFDLHEPTVQDFAEQDLDKLRARVREKRWAVYTARAVDRYISWWTTCIPRHDVPPKVSDLEGEGYHSITGKDIPLSWVRKELPPLDVLMVWHSHMLNPRAFFEDCIRDGKLNLWTGGFPWGAINNCIDDRTLDYDAGDEAKKHFETRTDLAWDNLLDSPQKLVKCPSCDEPVSVPWSQGTIPLPIDSAFEKFDGFADKSFSAICHKCGFKIDHERLKIQNFRKDVRALLIEMLPMPGTLYNLRGCPNRTTLGFRQDFPNRLITVLGDYLLDYTDPRLDRCKNMTHLRDTLETKLQDRQVMEQATIRRRLDRESRVAFRRMMSHYWDNIGPFALDLVGAVIRQGTFIQKMDNIDWLHSPTVMETMDRLIKKYHVFFKIMVSHPSKMAVPTLDVDLAWHTHQLSPSRYFQYSIHHSRQYYFDTFIDHDDKVDENKLSEGFEWTSKVYKKLTNGGVYSECTCWYCEAIRAPDLHSGFFVSPSTAKAREIAANLHNRPDISSDPEKNPHISAHNAVRAVTESGVDSSRLTALKLRSNYEKARRRAEKKDRKGNRRDSAADGGIYYVPMVWGVPYYMPFYGPYMCDPGVCPDAYVANPSCMSFLPGAHGNCAAGTCGGAVAAGGCGGIGGACGGGSVGGSVGGCGGGGIGGGCGGGGGFGGRCGGGGGGGCGGGGGGGCGGGGC